ncbi:hypothetical protein LZC95_00290 [Pendulispora brunnea]|uniref:Uncharacterized protein n=1 Tax=Pendulispora brunnea TaxID=2905690 RepID=A0ABZ2K9B5_9BACT
MFKKWSIAFVLGLVTASFGLTVGSTASAADDVVDQDEEEDFASAFIGTWTFQAGSNASSPCLSTPIDLANKSSEVTAGANANEVVADVQGCKIPFVHTDATHAKLKARTSCKLTDGSTTYNVNVTSATLALGANGVLSVEGAGTANVFCSVKLTGTAVK